MTGMNQSIILHDVYLGLGSNLGDREQIISSALKLMESELGEVVSVSSFYKTAPVGFESENYFINAACHLRTPLGAREVLTITKRIEQELGRTSKSTGQKYSDRVIDIDILLYDDRVIESENLKVPHPFMHQRSFVLQPLAEIAPQVIHPILNKNIKELYSELR